MAEAEKRTFIAEYLRLGAKKLSAAQVDLLVQSPASAIPLFLRAVLDDLQLFASFEGLDAQIASYLSVSGLTLPLAPPAIPLDMHG